jgi:hypothetical protein
VLDSTAFRRGRVLQLARPVRLKARRHRATARRGGTGVRHRARGVRFTAALRGGLTAPGRRRVSSPIGSMPATLAGTATLTGTAALAGAPLTGPALTTSALTAAPLSRIARHGG